MKLAIIVKEFPLYLRIISAQHNITAKKNARRHGVGTVSGVNLLSHLLASKGGFS